MAPPAENGFVTHDLIRVMPTEESIGLWLVFRLSFSPSAGVLYYLPLQTDFYFFAIKIIEIGIGLEI